MRNDLTFVAITIAFFVIAALFVVACDRIIGSDEVALATRGDDARGPEPDDQAEQVAA